MREDVCTFILILAVLWTISLVVVAVRLLAGG